jgi:hypothetical protein
MRYSQVTRMFQSSIVAEYRFQPLGAFETRYDVISPWIDHGFFSCSTYIYRLFSTGNFDVMNVFILSIITIRLLARILCKWSVENNR